MRPQLPGIHAYRMNCINRIPWRFRMKQFRSPKLALSLIFLIGFPLVLFGCGGENGGVTSPPATSGGENVTISGTAVKGPVGGGMLTAYAMSNGTRGGQLGSATTDAQGNFS